MPTWGAWFRSGTCLLLLPVFAAAILGPKGKEQVPPPVSVFHCSSDWQSVSWMPVGVVVDLVVCPAVAYTSALMVTLSVLQRGSPHWSPPGKVLHTQHKHSCEFSHPFCYVHIMRAERALQDYTVIMTITACICSSSCVQHNMQCSQGTRQAWSLLHGCGRFASLAAPTSYMVACRVPQDQQPTLYGINYTEWPHTQAQSSRPRGCLLMGVRV